MEQRPDRHPPLLDVYAAAVPPDLRCGTVFSPARARLLEETRSPSLKCQRWLVWHLLELAAVHSLGLEPENLIFQREQSGRWRCDAFEFSLSHARDVVAVAVSRSPVGVDVESLPDFARRYTADPALCRRVLRRIAAESELKDSEGCESERLLRLWTGKESLFKYRQRGSFLPEETVCGEETRHFLLSLPPKVCLAVSSDVLPALRVFLLHDGALRPVTPQPLAQLTA